MGQRFKGHIPTEMEDDKGLPGKLYFEEPMVVDIAVVRNGNNVSTVDLSATTGPVRLASSVLLRDFHRNKPVMYQMGLRPQLSEIQEYIKAAEIMGYGLGSIVARRFCADWRYETPFEWGAIMGVRAYMANVDDQHYAPFTVRWFNRNNPEEGAWAEDLYVIHQCLSRQLLNSIIEDQQEGVAA